MTARGPVLAPPADLKDSVVAARLRVGSAVEALGPELSGVASMSAASIKGLEMVERERLMAAALRQADAEDGAACNSIATTIPRAPASKRRSHAWGADGYRPEG